MAVSKPDFTRQFGSAKSDLTPVSNTNYLQGWDFVGSTPPTKNDFTYLQNLADQRSIWLFENYGAGRLLNIRVFTASSLYTPTPGTKRIKVYGVGAGGAGGGVGATPANSVRSGGGGGAGTYGEAWITTVPESAMVTPGAPGAPITGGDGGAGTATTFGSLLTLPGGGGGHLGLTVSNAARTAGGGSGAAAATGAALQILGQRGADSFSISATTVIAGGGASTPLGQGAPQITATSTTGTAFSIAGSPGMGYGSGGGGALSGVGGAAQAGGAAGGGVIIIEEYA